VSSEADDQNVKPTQPIRFDEKNRSVTENKRLQLQAREQLAEYFSAVPFDRDELWPLR
jgi:hypothetical protein